MSKRKQAKRKADKKAQKEEKEGNGVSLKEQGSKAFVEKRYEDAVRLFTQAIAEDPSNAILFSNRSACYSANFQFDEACRDAEEAIVLAPSWSKGYLRKGQALEGLMQLQRAYESYKEGQALDESDAVIKRSLDELSVLMEDMKVTAKEASLKLNPEEDRFDAMITWLREGQAQFPYLYLQYYDEDYRGVHSLTKIPNNRIILEVPLSHIMTSDVAKASEVGQKIIKSGCELNSTHSYLASYLLQEKHNPNSFWKPYIRILPQHYRNMPIFFEGHDLDLLKGSFAIRKIIDRQEELKEEFENICLTGDHRVLTCSGWKSITRVQEGDVAMTFNTITYAMEWKPVRRVTSHDVDRRKVVDQLYRMQGSGMDVIATRNHRMLLARIDRKTRDDLTEGTPIGYETVDELLRLKYSTDRRSRSPSFPHCNSHRVVCAGLNHQPGVKIVIPGLERVCQRWWEQDRQLGFLRFLGAWLTDGHLKVVAGLVCIDQKKGQQSSIESLDQLLDGVFPRCWDCSAELKGSGEVMYTIRCPPLCEYLCIMAVGPIGYNPRDPAELRSYPHFTKDEQLATMEQQSDHYKPDTSCDRASTWSEDAMLAAFAGGSSPPSTTRSPRLVSALDEEGEREEELLPALTSEEEEGQDALEAEVPAGAALAIVDAAEVQAMQVAGKVVWETNAERIVINEHWFCLKRWLGDEQQVANVYSQLSRQQAVALLDGFCRADGLGSTQYDDSGEPTGAWRCSHSSFPLIDHLQLIGQLAGAAVDLHLLSKAGNTTIDGRTVSSSVGRWVLSFTFTQSAGGTPFPFQTAAFAQPVDVTDNRDARGYYQYEDDDRVYCLTVDGNSNFLTQRLSNKRLESGNTGVRAHSVFTGNCRHVPEFRTFGLEEFIWARLVVITRIFGLVVNNNKTDGLVPMADMLNHKRPRETSWTFDDARQSFTITSLKPMNRGEQIYDSYGRKCNSRFFVNYGFSLEDNEDNQIAVYVGLLHDDPHFAMKCRYLGGPRAGAQLQRFQIPIDYKEKVTKECFSFLRFAHAKDSELLLLSSEEKEVNVKEVSPISIRNEMSVVKHIARVCQACLAEFDSSIEEDERLLRGEGMDRPLSMNERNAILMRKGEKEVGMYYIELEREMEKLVNMPWKDFKRTAAKAYSGRGKFDAYITGVVVPLLKGDH